MTSRDNELCIASYTGLWFLDIVTLELSKEKYLEGNFVNKILEIQKEVFVVSVWDTNSFYFIDRKDGSVKTIKHPCGDFRCWGIIKLSTSLLLARDNFGLTLLNLA